MVFFTFYSQKYKVVCQEHHFVQNCTDSSKLSQTWEPSSCDKKITGRRDRSVICETGLLKLRKTLIRLNRKSVFYSDRGISMLQK